MGFTRENQPVQRRHNLTYERAEALRQEWRELVARAVISSGYQPAELLKKPLHRRLMVLRDEGLPTQAAFAARAGISRPLMSQVLNNKVYITPPEQLSVIRSRAGRTRKSRKDDDGTVKAE